MGSDTAPVATYPPCVGLIAPSGTGKTTLLRQLVPQLTAQGMRLGYLKHAHHAFDIDQPGKDSYVVRAAGATQVIIASEQRWVLLHEGPAPDLPTLLAQFDPRNCDLVLVEGFHRAHYPKIAVQRLAVSATLSLAEQARYYADPDLIAVVTDDAAALACIDSAPVVLALNNVAALAELIITQWTSGQLLYGVSPVNPVSTGVRK